MTRGERLAAAIAPTSYRYPRRHTGKVTQTLEKQIARLQHIAAFVWMNPECCMLRSDFDTWPPPKDHPAWRHLMRAAEAHDIGGYIADDLDLSWSDWFLGYPADYLIPVKDIRSTDPPNTKTNDLFYVRIGSCGEVGRASEDF